MGNKQKRHLTPQEINMQKQIDAYIDAEVRRRTEEMTLNEMVVNGIRATHKADMIISIIVLLDIYEASAEFCREYLDKWTELLKQYDQGIVQLKQLEGHIKVRTGIDIVAYAENHMDLAGIEVKNDEENAV